MYMKPNHTDAEILAFLHSNPMAVVSTIHKSVDAPESALVAFCETQDFEIIFQTFNNSRKYENLQHNSNVAFVIGWDIDKSNQRTLQYEGTAQELSDMDYKKYRHLFETKDTPCKKQWLDKEESRLFIVKPTWIGYSDYTKEIPKITEKFFN